MPSFVPTVQNEPLSRCYQGKFDRDHGRDALHPLVLLAFKKCMITLTSFDTYRMIFQPFKNVMIVLKNIKKSLWPSYGRYAVVTVKKDNF